MSGIGKATWIHHLPVEGPEAIRAVARRLADAGVDAVIPCIKNVDGYADFQSRVANVRPAFVSWDPLQVLCDEARRVGLQVHAWCCVFPEGNGSALLQRHPEYRARDIRGRESGAPIYNILWACSSRPEVQEYELALYQELLDNYDLTAVHLDYIRYSHPGDDFGTCYCAYCRETFQKLHGVDPIEIDQAHGQFSAWVDWRAANITRFAERVRERANQAGKQLTAAVFHNYPDCLWQIGQDWVDWGRRGLIDVMMPMNYTMSARIAIEHTRNHRQALNGTTPLWEGLWNRPAMTTPELLEQIEGVLAEGAQGVSIFEYFGLSDEDLTALKAIR